MKSGDDHLEWLFHSDDESEEDLITGCVTNVRQVGRPSIAENHPDIVEAVTVFIELSTAGAHLRRRSKTMYTNGVTLMEIAQHVQEKFGVPISTNTIHRMLLPEKEQRLVRDSSPLYLLVYQLKKYWCKNHTS